MWIGFISEYENDQRFQFYLFIWFSCGTRDLRYSNAGSFFVAHTLSPCGVPALEHQACELRCSTAREILVLWPQIKHLHCKADSLQRTTKGEVPCSPGTPLPLWMLLLPSPMMGSSQTSPTPFPSWSSFCPPGVSFTLWHQQGHPGHLHHRVWPKLLWWAPNPCSSTHPNSRCLSHSSNSSGRGAAFTDLTF